jgi:two-component flavin-dependent monooxygenase
VPHRAISGVLFASPALGAARGAHRSWARRITEGGGWPGGSPTRRAAAHLTAARVAGEIDIAELLLRRAAAVCDSGPVHPAETLRNAHDCALAADRLVGAVETLFRTAGSRGQLMNSALQRFWRDVHSLASHVALQLEPSAGAYGEFLLDGGLPA